MLLEARLLAQQEEVVRLDAQVAQAVPLVRQQVVQRRGGAACGGGAAFGECGRRSLRWRFGAAF